ncbi:YwqI/YxiC family protein [Pseudalkalibacillus decolorationis]|uniref:YwqI/YxiC family protein n=1 Tax=Pseudalkalibacillus decolorationis TaxID=163879 RepID=UPI002148BF0E|nr:YwqI/YxiC family protein [Pseudalkalibacillus decolorationis]
MHVRSIGGGTSSQQIKLNHAVVMAKLGEVKSALESLQLAPPPSEQLGQNKLSYTDFWQEREQGIHKMIKEYISVVEKNIDDTKANVDSLKEQDEAITRT